VCHPSVILLRGVREFLDLEENSTDVKSPRRKVLRHARDLIHVVVRVPDERDTSRVHGDDAGLRRHRAIALHTAGAVARLDELVLAVDELILLDATALCAQTPVLLLPDTAGATRASLRRRRRNGAILEAMVDVDGHDVLAARHDLDAQRSPQDGTVVDLLPRSALHDLVGLRVFIMQNLLRTQARPLTRDIACARPVCATTLRTFAPIADHEDASGVILALVQTNRNTFFTIRVFATIRIIPALTPICALSLADATHIVTWAPSTDLPATLANVAALFQLSHVRNILALWTRLAPELLLVVPRAD
jgi:hypothetical protein